MRTAFPRCRPLTTLRCTWHSHLVRSCARENILECMLSLSHTCWPRPRLQRPSNHPAVSFSFSCRRVCENVWVCVYLLLVVAATSWPSRVPSRSLSYSDVPLRHLSMQICSVRVASSAHAKPSSKLYYPFRYSFSRSLSLVTLPRIREGLSTSCTAWAVIWLAWSANFHVFFIWIVIVYVNKFSRFAVFIRFFSLFLLTSCLVSRFILLYYCIFCYNIYNF